MSFGLFAETAPRALGPRQLFAISFSILFLEMACIRWLNSTVPVLSYFNNLILMSCFLGLGLGCLLASRKTILIRWYAPVFLVLVVAVVFLQRFSIDISYREDYLFVPVVEGGFVQVSYAVLCAFFVNVAFFLVLGQELGKQLASFANPLRAYAYDIGGSLVGVVLYTFLAWLQTPPHAWYAMGLLILVIFLGNSRWIVASLVIVGASLWIMTSTYEDVRWSPYYKVETRAYVNEQNQGLGHQILVDNLRIQDALNFSPQLLRSPLRTWLPYYELPYHLVKPRKMLILGAGAGNEAVVALNNGVQEVHVVEIDPVIADFGYSLHPNEPYTYENVTVIVDDARSYVSRTDERYDLIVMSALDSHKQIAGMSSLRLESFVYTVESYRQIRRLLAPGGVFCMNQISSRPWMGERTYWSLTEAFGTEPLVLRSSLSPFSSMAFVYGPEDVLDRERLSQDPEIEFISRFERRPGMLLATDNWPHLYLEGKTIPVALLVVLGLILAASVLTVVSIEPAVRRPSLHFFFLGAGFMLLETRSITQMALLFGATWIVNAIVFIAILGAIFVTNQMILRGTSVAMKVSYPLLLLTLLLGYFFPFELLFRLSAWPRLAAAAAVIGLPIVWASFIFSTSFKASTQINKVFGSNLLGVVCGGAIEYMGNLWGMQALYLVAVVLYAGSLVFLPREH